MLTQLHIENLAVIENADVTLGDKLTVFTGETGAGKSILIGGINAILGQRVTKDIIRTGTDKAYVSAMFDDLSDAVKSKASEIGIELDDVLIISREISRDGKSVARINSRPVSVTAIKELGNLLINIHGQHDSQVLLDPDKHLSILDDFGELNEMLFDYRSSFRELQSVAREMQRVKQEGQAKAQRETYLNCIATDIGALDILEGEDEIVADRFKFADNAVSLGDAIRTALTLLQGDDDSSGTSDMISKAYTEISIYDDIMTQLSPINERLSNVGIELGEICRELSGLLNSVDIDEEEYARLKTRQEELTRIKRRYGPTLNDVLKLYNESLEELTRLGDSQLILEELSVKKNELLSQVSVKAKALSESRRDAALRFCKEVGDELRFLNMPDVSIAVDIKTGKLTSTGMDTVEFLISANKGETPKALAKIASGGELSRIMLALKSVLAGRDDVPTMIFDEIDTGVSGRAAQKIGTKLREISNKRQVICVTHLTQIAVMAHDHILIEKNSVCDRTVTEIKPLSFEERKYEIARILGGDNITPTVLMDAEEQLKLASEL